jgi:CRP-like cAMP-binding protein/RsiW-degrading membrane proteinase PrsW (M82 family)
MSDIAAYLIAILAPLLAIYLVVLLDLFGTGKGSTIIICAAWGAFGAVAGAYLVNRLSITAIGFTNTSNFTAPIIEELLKALILLYFVQRPRFRYFVDGAVYGFAVGMGFAITENLFYILVNQDQEVLALIAKRVLSSSLMHGFASAILGISLGLMRRSNGQQRWALLGGGLLAAILIHMLYNNLVNRIDELSLSLGPLEVVGGDILLLAAMGFGLGGGFIIGYLIQVGLRAEKRRFGVNLGLSEGVSAAERRAVQQLGQDSIDHLLEELSDYFGPHKGVLIRQLLVKQANIGILKNNLSSPSSPRLQTAWREEITQLRGEVDHIRDALGVYVMMLLRSLLPAEDDHDWEAIQNKVVQSDPLHCHQFDLFITASKMAHTLSAQQLEQASQLLQSIRMFDGITLSDLENLSRAITLRQLKAGEVLFKRDDEGDAMYLIEQGHLLVYTHDQADQPIPLRLVSAGDVVGELALLDGLPRSAWVKAKIASRVWMLQRHHFLMFVQSRPHVMLSILVFMAARIRYSLEKNLASPVYDEEEAIQRVSRAFKLLGGISDPDLQERATRSRPNIFD